MENYSGLWIAIPAALIGGIIWGWFGFFIVGIFADLTLFIRDENSNVEIGNNGIENDDTQ